MKSKLVLVTSILEIEVGDVLCFGFPYTAYHRALAKEGIPLTADELKGRLVKVTNVNVKYFDVEGLFEPFNGSRTGWGDSDIQQDKWYKVEGAIKVLYG